MKDRVVFKTGKFTDFSGKERVVTFCAISTEDIDMFDPYEAIKKVLLGDKKDNVPRILLKGLGESYVKKVYNENDGILNAFTTTVNPTEGLVKDVDAEKELVESKFE